VVWFGEALPAGIINRAFDICGQARTMLVVGTSAVVNPAAQLPLVAKGAGAHLVEFNLEATPVSTYADETILGPAAETLPEWWESIRA
jgi:NAD-dependent deacetylase